MYGTAWNEDRTAALTSLAIDSGFRTFDTANQRKHYFEAEMGRALKSVIMSGVVARIDHIVDVSEDVSRLILGSIEFFEKSLGNLI